MRDEKAQVSIEIPATLDYDVWRLVGAGLGTLVEIENEWSIEDVYNAHMFLDVREDLEVLQSNSYKDR